LPAKKIEGELEHGQGKRYAKNERAALKIQWSPAHTPGSGSAVFARTPESEKAAISLKG
jgi:hypothetical protein